MLTRKGQDALALGALVVTLAVAGTLSIVQVRVSQRTVDVFETASPLGYTFSLALFALPCAIFGVWVGRSPRTPIQRRASVITLILLIPLGFILDVLFGRAFLTFPSHHSTLGILLPGYDLRTGWRGLFGPGWSAFLPLEEFLFYALGFVAMLLIYIWGDEVLFRASKVDDRQRTPAVFRGWKATLPFWLIVGAVLFGIAWLIRRSVPSVSGHAFPGYFLFLLIGSIIPSLFCSRVAFQFINWRSLALSWLFVLAIGQYWEASLGIPYGWWGYQPDQMMGIFLKPFCDLPIEAACVWTLGTWTTVIIYETVLTALCAGRRGWGIFGVVQAEEEELEMVKARHQSAGRDASCLLGLCLASSAAETAPPGIQAVARTDANSRIAHEQLLAKAKQGRIDVYFIGDSIVRRWGTSDPEYRALFENWTTNFHGWNVANFGWGADKIENILWRLENGELDNVHPRIIVIHAGINNVGKNPGGPETASYIANGIRTIVETCRQKAPAATVILTALFPRNDAMSVLPLIKEINSLIASMADGDTVRFVDINSKISDPEGRFFEGMVNADQLHPALKTYQIWADRLKPIFQEILGPPALIDRAPPPTGDPSRRPR